MKKVSYVLCIFSIIVFSVFSTEVFAQPVPGDDIFFMFIQVTLRNSDGGLVTYMESNKLIDVDKKIINDSLDYFSSSMEIPIFELNDKRLSENSLRYTVNKVFKRVGLKVSPHQLRHSYATELLNNSASISDVSELLGHSSMSTTQIYTKLGSVLKQQNYNKAHQLSSKSKLDV